MGWRWSGYKNGEYWRIAESVKVLGDQIIDAAPNRDVTPDGTVASAGHTTQNPTSDHEPGKIPIGVVCAIDIAHNPGPDGTNVQELFDSIALRHDPRVKYMIHNRQIMTYYDHPKGPAWKWRPYTGSNAHLTHGHLSVRADRILYDDMTDWEIGAEAMTEQFTEHQAHLIREWCRGVDKFNTDEKAKAKAEGRDADLTTGYGVGRLQSKTIRQHERDPGTGWDHP